MKILVTGATGFLGKCVAFRLKAEGHEVRGLGRNNNIGILLQNNGIEYCQTDFADEAKVIEACRGMDYVMHCGAMSSPWGKYKDFYTANVLGTRNVVSGCLKHDVKRLIHISTPSLYFDFKDRFNISESEQLPGMPCNTYALTKLLAEMEVDSAKGLHAITLRPRGIFGPGDNAILPRLILANRQKRLPLICGGEALIDMTYVENVVDSMILCINSPLDTIGKKYNISNGEPWKLKDLLPILFRSIDEPFSPKSLPYSLVYSIAWLMEKISINEPPLTRYTVGILAKSQTLNIQGAMNELGYRPRVSILEGINHFATWWKEQNES